MNLYDSDHVSIVAWIKRQHAKLQERGAFKPVGPKGMIRRIISVAGAILALAVLTPIALITYTYIVRPRQGESLGYWFEVLLPMVPPVVSLISSVILWRSRWRTPAGKGVEWGLFIACTAYMVLQALTLASNYTLISQDGTAHWGLLQMPVILVGLPLVVIGIGIGALGGWFVGRKASNQSVQTVSTDTAKSDL